MARVGFNVEVSRDTGALVAFAIQVVIGSLAFLTVFLCAVGIAWTVHYFEGVLPLPGWLAISAQVVEVVIWAVDLVVFGLFLLSEVIKAWRSFWASLKAN